MLRQKLVENLHVAEVGELTDVYLRGRVAVDLVFIVLDFLGVVGEELLHFRVLLFFLNDIYAVRVLVDVVKFDRNVLQIKLVIFLVNLQDQCRYFVRKLLLVALGHVCHQSTQQGDKSILFDCLVLVGVQKDPDRLKQLLTLDLFFKVGLGLLLVVKVR